tara:strand:- start:5 stop:379 length:375 start_codon:yes stop_codon:yes gene_type:complete
VIILRLTLALALIAVSCAKFLSGYRDVYILPELLWFFMACLEMIAGLLLLRSPSILIYRGVAALALAGLAIPLIMDDTARCGCLGSLMELTRWRHVMLAASFGGLASIAWSVEVERRRSAIEAS